MKSHLGSPTWLDVASIAGALLSGPVVMGAVLLFASTGLVVLPEGAPRFSGPKGTGGSGRGGAGIVFSMGGRGAR